MPWKLVVEGKFINMNTYVYKRVVWKEKGLISIEDKTLTYLNLFLDSKVLCSKPKKKNYVELCFSKILVESMTIFHI